MNKEIEKLKSQLQEEIKNIDELTRVCESWPTIDILKKLCEASDILLKDKNYDGHGWELIFHAKNEGLKLIKEIKEMKIKRWNKR